MSVSLLHSAPTHILGAHLRMRIAGPRIARQLACPATGTQRSCRLREACRILVLLAATILGAGLPTQAESSSPTIHDYLGANRKDVHAVPQADTLRPGVAWWQPSGGPFRGLCAEPWSLGLLAVVQSSRLLPAAQELPDTAMPPSMEGTLRVLEIFHAASLPKEAFLLRNGALGTGVPGTELFVSIGGAPFEGLVVGDTVMAFLYEYEGHHTFPPVPMLKVRSRQDPVVASLRRFVASGFSPLAIEADTSLWRPYGHDSALTTAVECHRNPATSPSD